MNNAFDKGSIFVLQSVVSEKAKEYVKKVMDSNWIGLGKMVAEFEEKFADYCGAKYCIGLNSATAAIHLSLISAKKFVSKILTTPITFVSVNNCILQVDSFPCFCDVNPVTGNVNLETIRDNIDFQCNTGIIFTHYAGNLIDKETIGYARNMLGTDNVINDYSHCAGAKYNDQSIINTNYNVFSFHAVKNISSPDGGAIVTNNKEIYERLKKLRWCGIDKSTFDRQIDGYNWRYNVDELGYKYHMNDITAAFVLANLEDLDENNKYRLSIMKKYFNGLHSSINMIPFTDGSSGHLAVIKVPERISRDKVIELLAKNNIFCGVHYMPNNHYSLFKDYKFSTPNADLFFERIITLPCHLGLKDSDVDRVINTLNEIIIGMLKETE